MTLCPACPCTSDLLHGVNAHHVDDVEGRVDPPADVRTAAGGSSAHHQGGALVSTSCDGFQSVKGREEGSLVRSMHPSKQERRNKCGNKIYRLQQDSKFIAGGEGRGALTLRGRMARAVASPSNTAGRERAWPCRIEGVFKSFPPSGGIEQERKEGREGDSRTARGACSSLL